MIEAYYILSRLPLKYSNERMIEFEVQSLHYTVYGISSEIFSSIYSTWYKEEKYWIYCFENKYLHSKNMHEISLVSTRRRIL